MDAPSPMTPIQLLLAMTLLGLLVTWMVTFLVLALRPEATKRHHAPTTQDEHISYTAIATTASPPPVVHTPAPVMMRVMTGPPGQSPS